MNDLMQVALAMSVVTMIPRVLPMFFIRAETLPAPLQRFFACLPAAMLTALVFPGVASASGSTSLSLTGAAAALALGIFRVGPAGTVAGCVILLYALQTLGWMN